MSVTAFNDLRKLREARQAADGREQGERLPSGRLTTQQFNRHLSHVEEEQTRLAIARTVGEVDPGEVLDLARRVANLRARYVATALASAGGKAPPTKAEIEEMRFMRERIAEMDHALSTVREAIASELITVKNVSPD